jgi:phosphoribosylglycinamide formyltransferase 1
MAEEPAAIRARRRAAVLISGRGSNLRALIDHCEPPDTSAEIVLVVSDQPEAPGLDHARAAGIGFEIIVDRSSRAELERQINESLQTYDIDVVCLAGFMRVLSPGFVERWRDRLLNIHPSLLPAFRGLDTHRRALEAGVRFHGCTVHFVRAEVDSGPIIIQGVLAVRQDDTVQSLAARVLALEHRCYPQALDLVASGRARVVGERVVCDPPSGSLAADLRAPWIVN